MEYTGLSAADVEKSRAAHGSNIIPDPVGDPLWKRYLEKFEDPLIIILLVAGALSVGIAIYEKVVMGMGPEVFFEPAGIFIAIFLATALAFIFELRADKAFALLNRTTDAEPVLVVRDGKTVRIPKSEVVVGDILVLSTGEAVPADATLLESVSMQVDESSLTGEPSCRKDADPSLADPEATYPTDVVLRDTRILEGHGVARVTSVGIESESGKVLTRAGIDSGVRTPLNEQLDRLGDLIAKASYVLAGLIIAGRLGMWFLTGQEFSWVHFSAYGLETIMIAVALVVVSVPEGLPMAVTLSLAYSMRRMLKANNLVRKMHACETMGACTVICTDKTGTLTENRMRVADIAAVDFAAETAIMQNAILNSTARIEGDETFGNPTEGALLAHYGAEQTASLRGSSVVELEIPFDTRRKYMAAQVRVMNGDGSENAMSHKLFVKGAPEIVMAMCGYDGNLVKTVKTWQARGMRTLAFASALLPDRETAISEGNILDGVKLELDGVAGILDPVRAEVPAAMKSCAGAGIDVKMVTGDTKLTAEEIGRQAGILKEGKKVVTGPEIEAMSDSELEASARDIGIIARARPLDKERFVKALQAAGEVVAVTGDGTNDAPALNAAHVGLSMGSGTSVAKEASDITIIDDSFASIASAVMWGRSLYANIQRFILFQMTVNVAACLTVLAGAFTGTESPLTVTQMLWVNLIMDTFAAMALASLPPNPNVMFDTPRKREDFIIPPAMKRNILLTGGTFFVILLTLALMLEYGGVTTFLATDAESSFFGGGFTPYKRSLFFTFFVMLQWWNLFNAKAWHSGKAALDLKDCGAFTGIAVLILAGQALIVNFGGAFFNVAPISLSDWAIIILVTSPVFVIGELIRKGARRAVA